MDDRGAGVIARVRRRRLVGLRLNTGVERTYPRGRPPMTMASPALLRIGSKKALVPRRSGPSAPTGSPSSGCIDQAQRNEPPLDGVVAFSITIRTPLADHPGYRAHRVYEVWATEWAVIACSDTVN